MSWIGRLLGRDANPPAEQRYSLAELGQMWSLSARSYADIDLSTAESALQDVAFASGVELIASLVSELPLTIYLGTGAGARTAPVPSYLEDPGGDGYGREDWTYKYVASHLTRGNVFGDILDRRQTYLTQVDLFHPDKMRPWIDSDGVVHWMVNGEEVPAPQVYHDRSRAFPGNLLGLSPIELHATQLGLSIGLVRFGKQWFEEGAVPATVLHNTERDLTGPQARTAKERFMAGTRGKREPVILDRGWKLDQVQVAPEESQFLQTQQFSEAQCARILGPGVAELLGYETGGNLTYSTSRDRNNDFQKLTLNKWINRVERAYRRFLPPGQIPRLDRDALLEALPEDRYNAYATALGGVPWMKPSEVRPKEGLPADPAMDQVPNEGGGPDDPGTE